MTRTDTMDSEIRMHLAKAPQRRLAAAWLLLAVAALGLSALYASLLLAARVPYAAAWFASRETFYPALASHVALSTLVWFLSLAAACWNAASGAAAMRVRWGAWALAAAGVAAIALAPSAGGIAWPSNYVPVLDNALFVGGLCALAAGVVLTLAVTLPGSGPGGNATAGSWSRAVKVSSVPAIVAVVCLIWTVAAMPPGLPSAQRFELLFWSSGHVLQFGHVALMVLAWVFLASLKDRVVAPRALLGVVTLVVAPALLGLAIHAAWRPETPAFRDAFTSLMSLGTWAVAVPAGLYLVVAALRSRSDPLAVRALALSLALFCFGCALGASIQGETTLVPAHYHGTVGAVTLALMALARAMAPALGWREQDLRRWSWDLLYGAGVLLLMGGMAWSGFHDVPRKAVWNGEQDMAIALSHAVAALGGALAIVAVVVFAASVASSARAVRGTARVRRRDTRMQALLVTVGLVAGGGMLIAAIGAGSGRPAPAPGRMAKELVHAGPRSPEVQARFEQGVVMLHAKQYEHALTAFHRVLQLAPEMPEAHVNMGFALIGLKRFAAARDFFESATVLRATQVNAYYGLAMALEGMEDLRGATGAMRTFVHLSSRDDPYVRKAEAALWEWESELAKRPAADRAEAAAGPGTPPR